MRMRNVLIFGFAASAMAASAILLSGCETYPAQRSYQVMPGPPVANESVVIVVPDQNRRGYGNVQHERKYGYDENRRHEENTRRDENVRRDEENRRAGNRGRDENIRREDNVEHRDNDSARPNDNVRHDPR